MPRSPEKSVFPGVEIAPVRMEISDVPEVAALEREVFTDPELRLYITIIAVATCIVTGSILLNPPGGGDAPIPNQTGDQSAQNFKGSEPFKVLL